MRRPLISSLLLHAAVFAVAYFGLPAPEPMLPMETAIVVDVVAVAEKTNTPPAREKPKPAEKPVPKPAAELTPPPPEPAPKSEVAALAPPKAKPTPASPPEKVEKVTPKPTPPEKSAKAEPKPEPKPEPKQEEPPPEAFDSVLKTVEQLKRQPPKAVDKAEEKQSGQTLESQIAKAVGKSAEPYDEGLPMTMSEIESMRRQIERCWNLPAGAKDAKDLVVSIQVEMNIDGTPRSAVVTDQNRLRADPFYRAAAESALRAVLNPRCHPFTLPPDKYKRWKTMTLVFNPKEMFGT